MNKSSLRRGVESKSDFDSEKQSNRSTDWELGDLLE
jgi:hypothetical protein